MPYIAFTCYNKEDKVESPAGAGNILCIKCLLFRNNKSLLLDEHFAAVEEAREESVLILRNFYKSEEIFLDMFEDEYRQMTEKKLNFEFIMSDASLLLPPTGTPLTGIDFRSVVFLPTECKLQYNGLIPGRGCRAGRLRRPAKLSAPSSC